jgi:hypothetical protein
MDIYGRTDPTQLEKPQEDIMSEIPPPVNSQELPLMRQKSNNADMMSVLGRIMGGQHQSGDMNELGPNGAWEYTKYKSIDESYVPIGKTYEKMKFEPHEYESFEYEPMEYEPIKGSLFGHDDTDHLGESFAMKPTGVSDKLFQGGESELFKPSKIGDRLFKGEGEENPWLSGEPASPAIVASQETSYGGKIPSGAEILATIERRKQASMAGTPIASPAPILQGLNVSYKQLIPTGEEVLAATERLKQTVSTMPGIPNQVQYSTSGQPKIKRKPGRPRKYPPKAENAGINIPNQ